MALEAWGHDRIEECQAINEVLADVLGPSGSFAAFLAVAVDLVLSHLPKNLELAATLAASAQLLALDQQRVALEAVRQQQDIVDKAMGVAWTRAELPGLATRESLHSRPSRSIGLDTVLHLIGEEGPPAVREAIRRALSAEAARLGPPADDVPLTADSWSDPRVMAVVARHRLEPIRYTKNADGSVAYQLSDMEVRLLQARTNVSHSSAVDVQLRLHHAVRHGPVDLQFLCQALAWLERAGAEAQAEFESASYGGDYFRDVRRSATVAAMLVLRDGDGELREQHADWAHSELLEAAGRPRARSELAKDVPFNDAALAGMGWLASLRLRASQSVVRELLQLAARRDAGMSAVLALEINAGRPVDPLLARSLLRLGFESSILELQYQDLDEIAASAQGETPDYAARLALSDERRNAREDARLAQAVEAEVRWRGGTGPEPAWAQFPPPRLLPARTSRTRRASGAIADREARPQFIVAKTIASLWLQLADALLLPDAPQELTRLLDHFWPWTALANGVGLADGELADRSHEMRLGWNGAYFGLRVKLCVVEGKAPVADCLQLAGELPVDAFLDAAAAMLRDVDRLWLQQGAIELDQVRQFRQALIDRLALTWEWQTLVRQVSDRGTLPMVDLIAALFFGEHELGKGPKCLLGPKGAATAEALLPLLADVATQAARSVVVVHAFLGLMEVDPKWRHLPLLAKAHAAWYSSHGADRRFWDAYGVAERLCSWLVAAMAGQGPPTSGPSSGALVTDAALVAMLDALVRVGSPAAQRLERQLGIHRSEGRG